mmetsp:Transcript_3744/g.10811  ORF Transcript_3744/g.10811 Transcript_3744/m.10811 type:complete len:201 (+) Transcript_3744:3656-4258(+)
MDPYGSLFRATTLMSVPPTSSRSLRESMRRSDPTDSQRCFFRSHIQFSRMRPASVLPLPTPAPSPMKKPLRCPSGRNVMCRCEAYTMLSSCSDDSNPLSICSCRCSWYVMSGGSTAARDAVSTTASGCATPIFSFEGLYSAKVLPASASSSPSSSSASSRACAPSTSRWNRRAMSYGSWMAPPASLLWYRCMASPLWRLW